MFFPDYSSSIYRQVLSGSIYWPNLPEYFPLKLCSPMK